MFCKFLYIIEKNNGIQSFVTAVPNYFSHCIQLLNRMIVSMFHICSIIFFSELVLKLFEDSLILKSIKKPACLWMIELTSDFIWNDGIEIAIVFGPSLLRDFSPFRNIILNSPFKSIWQFYPSYTPIIAFSMLLLSAFKYSILFIETNYY